MQHTLVAVFDNRSDAQSATDELLASGFGRTDVNLSTADPSGQYDSTTGDSERLSGEHEEGIGASIKHFFTGLFGSDNDGHASRYSAAVTSGRHVVTVTTESEPEVERAADIIERFGPIDIDERHDLQGHASTLSASDLANIPPAGSGIQHSAPMSAQSAQSANLGAGGLNPSNVDNRGATAPGALQNAQSASMQRDESDLPFPATQNLNDDVPRGTTYQESMGSSQADSLQNPSSLQGTASFQGGVQGQSLQRDTGGVRVFSRSLETPLAGGRASGLDDDYYRKDFDSKYSSLGSAYDDYEPAYRYGSESRGKYANRNWDDVETDLKSDWNTRYNTSGDPSAWEKFKAAVRHGWDKITPDNDDDDYYRSHWTSTYGSSGDTYDSYQPAYSYGNEARRNAKYSGRNWDDVESDLHSDWDTRYASNGGVSTWDKMKAAVRHGWNRMTS